MSKRIYLRRRRRTAGDYEIVQRHVGNAKETSRIVAQPMKPNDVDPPEKPRSRPWRPL